MELSLQFSRINFPTVSSSSPLHPSKRGCGFFAPSRSLGSHHGSCFGCFHRIKQPNQRFSRKCCLPHEARCCLRRTCSSPQSSLYSEPDSIITRNGCGCQRRGKLSRDVVVRSELAGTGSTKSIHEARCDLRRTCCPPQSSLYSEPDSNITRNGCGCRRRSKLSRDVVVRSELSGTGSSQNIFEFSEIWLNSKVRGICFYAVTAVAAIILFVPMLLEHPLVLMFDRYRRKAHYLVAKTWAFLTVAPFVKIEYEGLDNLPPTDTPAVYVSNHQSFLDIYALLTLGKCFKFISKTSVFLYPIIGWAMFLLGVIPLKRMDSKSQFDCLKQCMALIKKGASVFFFPEGTRSKDGKLGPFKKGAFSIAAKTGVPVVPISLIGTGEIMPPGFEGRLNPGSMKIIVHPSIVGNNPDALCLEARNLIAIGINCHG